VSKKKKKGKGSRRPGRPLAPTLPVGTAVRVKRGTPDPDFPEVPLGGWAGAVAEVDEDERPPLSRIVWSQGTLDGIPEVYRRLCEAEGLEVESTWLPGSALEPDAGGPLILELPQPGDVARARRAAQG
jgi:hypothetical protein